MRQAAHSARAGNLAEGTGAAEVASGVAEVDEVEDIRGFPAELEADAFVKGEIAE